MREMLKLLANESQRAAIASLERKNASLERASRAIPTVTLTRVVVLTDDARHGRELGDGDCDAKELHVLEAVAEAVVVDVAVAVSVEDSDRDRDDVIDGDSVRN